MGITITSKCDKHGELKWNFCPDCLAEKCEHGTSRSEHCLKCSADTSWADAPISDEELNIINRIVPNRWAEFGFRKPPRERNYTIVALLPKLVAEYNQLRKNLREA